tara:strand:- start:780 stop:2690 length:1911 start_codon:yes stop_codon:yes gene_type:complete
MSGGRSASRNVPPDLASSVAIARNALSNVSEIPLSAAEQLQLGPLTGRIARDAYGGDDFIRRGALFGTTNIAPGAPQAAVPEFLVDPGSSVRGFKGSSTSDIISGIPVREQVRPISMSRTVRPSAVQSPAPVDEFGTRPVAPTAPTSVESVAQQLNRQRNNAAALAELQKRGPVAVRPTGTMNNTVQRGLDLRNPAGSIAEQPYTTSRGVQRQAGGSTGGQMYNPQASAAPSASAQIRSMARDGGRLMDRVDAPARIPNGQGIVFPGGPLAIRDSIALSSPARLKVGRSLPIDYPQTDAVMRGVRELKDYARRNSLPYNPAARRYPDPWYVDASFARTNSLPSNSAARRYIDPASFVSNRVIPTNEGAFLTNLSDPRVLAALGVTGATGLGAGTYLLNKRQDGSVESQMPTVESPTPTVESPTPTVESRLPVTEFEKIMELLEKEKVIDTSLELSLREELKESLEPDVKTYSPTSVINQTRREREQQSGDLNAIINKYTEPMSPEKYSNIADYYRDRDNYASQDSRRDLLAAAVAELAGLQSENMRTWAQTHPGLAYQLLERQGFNAPDNPNANASVPGVKAVSDLGSNPGESALVAANGVLNSDLTLAAQPRINSVIEKIPLAIQQRLASQGLYS